MLYIAWCKTPLKDIKIPNSTNDSNPPFRPDQPTTSAAAAATTTTTTTTTTSRNVQVNRGLPQIRRHKHCLGMIQIINLARNCPPLHNARGQFRIGRRRLRDIRLNVQPGQ
ncbi:hypothetical protein I7I48_12043 [Histoplasma ohiense]|nr:hypothetical protein I7I48_12043 [Histoplasma ohiense (nom. inval.)]